MVVHSFCTCIIYVFPLNLIEQCIVFELIPPIHPEIIVSEHHGLIDKINNTNTIFFFYYH